MLETEHSKLRMQHFRFVQKLLKEYPDAAKLSILGKERSLLHHAILAGLPWHHSELMSVVPTTQDQSILQFLFEKAPFLMEHQDTCTGLFPWQLAAIVTKPQRLSKAYDDTVEQLDTIYNLLRLYPESITGNVRMVMINQLSEESALSAN
jgi:hypothetical protein